MRWQFWHACYVGLLWYARFMANDSVHRIALLAALELLVQSAHLIDEDDPLPPKVIKAIHQVIAEVEPCQTALSFAYRWNGLDEALSAVSQDPKVLNAWLVGNGGFPSHFGSNVRVWLQSIHNLRGELSRLQFELKRLQTLTDSQAFK